MKWFPRRWLQIRLSTAVVLMLAAGILIKANVSPHRISVAYVEDLVRFHVGGIRGERMTRYGWPLTAASNAGVVREIHGVRNKNAPTDQEIREMELFRNVEVADYFDLCRYAPNLKKRVVFSPDPPCEWKLAAVAINTGVALAILLVIAFFCEFLLRRQSAFRNPKSAINSRRRQQNLPA